MSNDSMLDIRLWLNLLSIIMKEISAKKLTLKNFTEQFKKTQQ